MKIQSRRYISYLFRMWQAEEAGKPVWRSSLEDPRTGKILFFNSLPLLFEFLEKAGTMPDADGSPAQSNINFS